MTTKQNIDVWKWVTREQDKITLKRMKTNTIDHTMLEHVSPCTSDFLKTRFGKVWAFGAESLSGPPSVMASLQPEIQPSEWEIQFHTLFPPPTT